MVPVTNEFKFELSNDDIGSIGNRNRSKKFHFQRCSTIANIMSFKYALKIPAAHFGMRYCCCYPMYNRFLFFRSGVIMKFT